MRQPWTRVLVSAVSLAGLAQGPRDAQSLLAERVATLTRDSGWRQVGAVPIAFPTHHPQGMVKIGDRLFVSSVEVQAGTRRYAEPVDGLDRDAGRGVGHLFKLDMQGRLIVDLPLGEGTIYHPGGIDFDGRNVWVPVAEYRPDSSAIVYRVDARTLTVTEQFEVDDHIGGLVLDKTSHRLVGNTWGSRRFYEWNLRGEQRRSWTNSSHFIDYQDCQYVPAGKMLCGGVTNLPQTPTAGGTQAVYELGGMALIDIRSRRVVHELPLQLWSTAGHVITRNPLKLAAHGAQLDLWAAPDNGDEGNGTEVLHYEATVAP